MATDSGFVADCLRSVHELIESEEDLINAQGRISLRRLDDWLRFRGFRVTDILAVVVRAGDTMAILRRMTDLLIVGNSTEELWCVMGMIPYIPFVSWAGPCMARIMVGNALDAVRPMTSQSVCSKWMSVGERLYALAQTQTE